MTTVLLADDHAMVRAGIERLLSAAPGIEVVGMDLSMPVLDGVGATRAILAEIPETKIVVLTSFMDRRRVAEALDAGAVGYVVKDAEPEELVRAVRSAVRGEMPLDPRVTRALIEGAPTVAPADAAELTDREREVLVLVTEGLANKLIARKLGISEKTVKAHLTRVFARLGVADRTQAALWARDHGLVPGPPSSS